ncbi:MAG: hypothetical protein IJ008_03910 [Clostridia bacterium]|nr:hypothetical protein [Clostridia bacterium]
MIETIKNWIKGIVEDDPIPYEIKYIYFLIVEDKTSYHLEFVGSEFKDTNNNYPFYVLEGEYCFLNYDADIKFFLNEIVLSLDLIFLDDEIDLIFKNKEIIVKNQENNVFLHIKN